LDERGPRTARISKGIFLTRKILLSIHIEAVRVRLSGLATTKEGASLGSLRNRRSQNCFSYLCAETDTQNAPTPLEIAGNEIFFRERSRKSHRARYITLHYARCTYTRCAVPMGVHRDGMWFLTMSPALALWWSTSRYLSSRPNENKFSRKFPGPFLPRWIFTLFDVVLAQLFS